MIRIEYEQPGDSQQIEALLDIVFGQGRFELSAYRLREGVPPVRNLSLKAIDAYGVIAATIRFWPIVVGDSPIVHLLLGPIAVHPIWQGEGIGSSLIFEGLIQAKRKGYELVILVGDESYYSRFGFQRNHQIIFPPPTDPARVLYIDLNTGSANEIIGQVHRAC